MVLDERLGRGMQRILSTYRYVNQQLTPTLLTEIARAGASGVEIFCSAFHFNYGNPQSVREIANSLDECGLTLQSLHSPTERDSAEGRASGLAVSISDPERIRRVEAVDEVKRALDVAEQIPVRIPRPAYSAAARAAHDRENSMRPLTRWSIWRFSQNSAAFRSLLENTPGEMGARRAYGNFVRDTQLERSEILLRHRARDISKTESDQDFEAMKDLVVDHARPRQSRRKGRAPASLQRQN